MVVDAEMKSNAKPKGKASGTKNFQPLEDINITKAYKEITTDAAVGTDQDGGVYYTRISERFKELMGGDLIQERVPEAVKNRWLNTIQKALLKFTACLNKAVSEYHWVTIRQLYGFSKAKVPV